MKKYVILSLVLAIVLSALCGCSITGRTLNFSTPRVEMSADTATIVTFPYKSNQFHY